MCEVQKGEETLLVMMSSKWHGELVGKTCSVIMLCLNQVLCEVTKMIQLSTYS